MSNTAWAYATAGRMAPELLDAIVAVAVRRLSDFNPQDLANTVWAYAKADHAAPVLSNAIAAMVVPRGPRQCGRLRHTARQRERLKETQTIGLDRVF